MRTLRHIHPPTSAHVDITVAMNTSFHEVFQFDEEDVVTWDFVDKSFLLEIKGNYEQDTPLLIVGNDVGEIVVDDTATRILHFNVAPSVLQAALVPGRYVYDLLMTDGENVVTQLMHGDFIFALGVTGVD